jgi:sulfatase modifying factor 1
MRFARTLFVAVVCSNLLGCPFLSDDWKIVSDAGSSSNAGSGANTSGAIASSGASGGTTAGVASGDSSGASSGTSGSGAGISGTSTAGTGTMSGSTTGVGPGDVAVLGQPCSKVATLACAGNFQKVTLICGGNPPTWTAGPICPNGQFCDSRSGSNQGTCQAVDPLCASLTPGELACSDATHTVLCGPDLVSDTPVATCANQTCISGKCSGPCAPNQMQCATTGNGVQTCGTDGLWGAAVACSASTTCVSGACSGVCGPGQKQCVGNTPQACGPTGQWVDAAACPSATRYCYLGACNAQPPSCAPGGQGLSNCGSSGESCCTSPVVPGGTFYRTYTNDGTGPTAEADPATVSGFLLDKYLVTMGRFRQYASAWSAGWRPAAGSGKHTHLNGGQGVTTNGAAGTYEPGWVVSDDTYLGPTTANLASNPMCDWTSAPGVRENDPVNCVSWYDAYAFCIWDGGAFLPTEAEWAFAAAGGPQQRQYPWGSAAPGSTNQYAIYACDYPPGPGAGVCAMDPTNIAPVGAAPAGAGMWGQLDLSGDLREWNLDYTAPYLPCTDCACLDMTKCSAVGQAIAGDSSPLRILRSSEFDRTEVTLLEAMSRLYGEAAPHFYMVGFRCARSP